MSVDLSAEIKKYFESYSSKNGKDFKKFEAHIKLLLKENLTFEVKKKAKVEVKPTPKKEVSKPVARKKPKKQEVIEEPKLKEELNSFPTTRDLDEWEDFLKKENLSAIDTLLLDESFADL